MKKSLTLILVLIVLTLGAPHVRTQEARPAQDAQKPVLYLVSTAHLDTQWNWTVQDSIREFIPSTFFDNFKLFEKYPHYVFTFEGAIHYMWFKEYHPEAWSTLKKYVADGRWRLGGSWINAVDTNIPSPEALMRQALYGKRFYRSEFSKVSQDIMLPDCFGFGFALPAIAEASGLEAFSTQKLSWGAPFPPPFAVGRWKGVDGSTVIAALRPGDYVQEIKSDPSIDPKWCGDLVPVGNGRSIGFKYFGVGDQGGAPDAASVEWVEKAIANPDAKVEVRPASNDQISRELTAREAASLPEYQGELLLKTHGVGCYTSQSAMKTWNRRNELLADAAERASVAAETTAGLPYPRERLRTAWTRFLWHQFHDDLTGTSIPQAYQFSWNDELISLNQFAGILTDAVRNVSASLDTRTAGTPLVVYNPIARPRKEPVEATVQFAGPAPKAVHVVDHATGQVVPAQVLSLTARSARILFLAEVPSVGFKVFEVLPGATSKPPASSLRVTPSSLESARYTVKIDANGDIGSVFDKDAATELLKAPARLQLLKDESANWPAWEITYQSVAAQPQATFATPKIRVIENGPVRVALEITRTAAGSTVTERVSLVEGGERVDVVNDVDWKSPGLLLKAAFPLAAANRVATYDLGLGTVERGNNEPNRYEVPAQQWADLTDSSNRFGVAIVNDAKYGWDKPDDNTLRLTLVRTPLPTKNYVYQSSNDIGRHHFTYALAGHRGGWRDGAVPMQAMSLNQPLVAFQTNAHAGALGPMLSVLNTDGSQGQFAVRAIKKAEDSDEIVVRVQELWGAPARASIGFNLPIESAREINAAEEAIRPASVAAGRVTAELARYQSRSFAITLQRTSRPAVRRDAAVIALPFNLDGVSTDADRADGNFDGQGHTLAAELLPDAFEMHGVPFRFGPATPGAANVVVPRGQSVPLRAGNFSRIYVLAAAVGGNSTATFGFSRKGAPATSATVGVEEWEGALGQWNSRVVDDRLLRSVYIAPEQDQSWTLDAIENTIVTRFDQATRTVSGLEKIKPAFVKRDEVAWVGTHRHGADGNQPYVLSYVFAYSLDVPKGTTAIRLPNNERLRILAITAVQEDAASLAPAGVLYAADIDQPSAPVRQPAAAGPRRRQ